MRWGLRSSKQQQREAQPPVEQERRQEGQGKKSKAIFSSFSPLAWLSKLTAKNGAAAVARPGHATPVAKTGAAQAATAFPSCFHVPTSPSPASASRSSPADSPSSAAEAARDIVPRRDDTGATAAEIAPRRRSVGNDDTGSEAAAARQLYRRRHYSVGGDSDLPPLSHLVSLSRPASPKALPTPTPAPVRTLTPVLPPLPSDTDEEKRPRSRRRRHRRVVSGRRSFSSARAPGARLAPAVRVRSPRPSSAAAAVSELERFAVVRRTRDPQREFRASMVEMTRALSAEDRKGNNERSRVEPCFCGSASSV